jgi:hypothetical protein
MRRCFAAVLAALWCVLGTAEAQNLNYNLRGAGARANGMGGAFIGVVDDATAIMWNPSGLTIMERLEGSVVGRNVADEWNESPAADHNLMNFTSLVIPSDMEKKHVVIGGAYQTQLDFYDKFRRGPLPFVYSPLLPEWSTDSRQISDYPAGRGR